MFGEITLLMVLQGAALVAAGAAAGYFLALNNFDKQRDKLKDELERASAELKEQREKVDNHFLKTAQLFNRLTDDYREIYEHLATGAQSLCSPQISTPQLDQPETRVLPAIEGSAAESEGESAQTAKDSSLPGAEAEAKDAESAEAKDSEKPATEATAEAPAPGEATEQKVEAETPQPNADDVPVAEKPAADDARIGADATPSPAAAGEEKPAAEAGEKNPATETSVATQSSGGEPAASEAAASDEEKPAPAVPPAAETAADVDRHKSPPSIH